MKKNLNLSLMKIAIFSMLSFCLNAQKNMTYSVKFKNKEHFVLEIKQGHKSLSEWKRTLFTSTLQTRGFEYVCNIKITNNTKKNFHFFVSDSLIAISNYTVENIDKDVVFNRLEMKVGIHDTVIKSNQSINYYLPYSIHYKNEKAKSFYCTLTLVHLLKKHREFGYLRFEFKVVGNDLELVTAKYEPELPNSGL